MCFIGQMSAETRQVDLIWDVDEDEPPQLNLSQFIDTLCERLGLDGVEVSVLITTGEKLAQLNHQYRHKNHDTDVLSFPAPAGAHGQSPLRHLGDIAISLDRARDQANQIGQSIEAEIRFLCLHGLLHLLGYDHETDDGEMMAYQAEIKADLAAYF